MTKGKPRKRPTGAADAKIDRLPSPERLQQLFGHAPPSERRTGPKPSRADLQRLYCREGQSVREIADALGCSKDMIHRALREYGIEARSNAKRSRLREIPLADLMERVEKEGLRAAARALGVDHSTLAHHLKDRAK